MANIFVIYDIVLRFKRRLAPYPSAVQNTMHSAHIEITGSTLLLPLFPSAPPFQPDLSRWKGMQVSNYNKGLLAKMGITLVPCY